MNFVLRTAFAASHKFCGLEGGGVWVGVGLGRGAAAWPGAAAPGAAALGVALAEEHVVGEGKGAAWVGRARRGPWGGCGGTHRIACLPPRLPPGTRSSPG